MAMGHVVLREFFVDATNDNFQGYVKQFTDLPYLVVLDEAAMRRTRRASASPPADLSRTTRQANAEIKR